MRAQTRDLALALFSLIAVSLIQLFFVPIYWNDKTSTVARIINNLIANKAFITQNFECINLDGTAGIYSRWAEEPPIFHLFAIPFKLIFGELSLKLIPLFSYVLNVIGVYFIAQKLSEVESKFNYLLLTALCFTPSLYIHAIRFLPDNLTLTCFIWGLYFYFDQKKFLSVLLFLMSVTSKILPIVPLFFFCIFHLYFYKKDFKKNFLYYISLGATIIPAIIWLIYLKKELIPNPFFDVAGGVPQHVGGANFEILTKYKYWSKIFQWYFYRGIGLVWLFCFILYLAKDKFRNFTSNQKVMILTAITFLLNVIILRGPQITAPWYSFCYQVFFIAISGVYFLKLSPKWQKTLVILSVLQSVFFLRYELHPKEQKFSDAPVEVNCDFHKAKAILDKKNMGKL